MLDYHIHSNFSEDSVMSMEALCTHALELKIKEIAITDHMDIDYPSDKYSFEIQDMDAYFHALEDMQEKYKGELIIRCGIELGLQPHVLERCHRLASSYPFDFIIASVHIIKGADPYLGHYYEGKSKEECYRAFYDETLSLIQSYDDFNVLGHLDYIKRYSPYTHESDDYAIGMDIVDEILKSLISRGKGIELNTSGYRQSIHQPLPHPKILERYKKLGGEIITLGSDAHDIHQISYEFSTAVKELKKAGFHHLTAFIKQTPCPLSLDAY